MDFAADRSRSTMIPECLLSLTSSFILDPWTSHLQATITPTQVCVKACMHACTRTHVRARAHTHTQ